MATWSPKLPGLNEKVSVIALGSKYGNIVLLLYVLGIQTPIMLEGIHQQWVGQLSFSPWFFDDKIQSYCKYFFLSNRFFIKKKN